MFMQEATTNLVVAGINLLRFFSELGRRVHGHDRLDVAKDQIRYYASIESRILGRLKLVLVDVAIVVANGRRDRGFRYKLS